MITGIQEVIEEKSPLVSPPTLSTSLSDITSPAITPINLIPTESSVKDKAPNEQIE